MKITKLEIVNFRNYEKQTVSFDNGLNVILGANAQGKTNLVEAIHFCSIGKSFRTAKDKELIKFGCEQSKIFLEIERLEGKKTVEIILSKTLKKIIRINGVSILRMGELMGAVNCVFFSPDDLRLIKDGPQDRRRFLDIDLSQMSKAYFYNLLRYEKILLQRNKLLKDSFDKVQAKNGLEVWNEQLAKVGAKIIYVRHKFIAKLSGFAKDIHSRLTSGEEMLIVGYSGIHGDSEDDIYRKLYEDLEKNTEKDFALGYTSTGPHRDDIKIVCNGIDTKAYGSQGQQRTSTLSLKLAELEIFKEEIGEYPILLLDDVFSELDEKRSRMLLSNISHVQTIITGTEFEQKDLPQTSFFVQSGNCKKQK